MDAAVVVGDENAKCIICGDSSAAPDVPYLGLNCGMDMSVTVLCYWVLGLTSYLFGPILLGRVGVYVIYLEGFNLKMTGSKIMNINIYRQNIVDHVAIYDQFINSNQSSNSSSFDQ